MIISTLKKKKNWSKKLVGFYELEDFLSKKKKIKYDKSWYYVDGYFMLSCADPI